jgi:hypothetical protein
MGVDVPPEMDWSDWLAWSVNVSNPKLRANAALLQLSIEAPPVDTTAMPFSGVVHDSGTSVLRRQSVEMSDKRLACALHRPTSSVAMVRKNPLDPAVHSSRPNAPDVAVDEAVDVRVDVPVLDAVDDSDDVAVLVAVVVSDSVVTVLVADVVAVLLPVDAAVEVWVDVADDESELVAVLDAVDVTLAEAVLVAVDDALEVWVELAVDDAVDTWVDVTVDVADELAEVEPVELADDVAELVTVELAVLDCDETEHPDHCPVWKAVTASLSTSSARWHSGSVLPGSKMAKMEAAHVSCVANPGNLDCSLTRCSSPTAVAAQSVVEVRSGVPKTAALHSSVAAAGTTAANSAAHSPSIEFSTAAWRAQSAAPLTAR